MNDPFEDRLVTLLNESVDAQLRTTRVAAPPFIAPPARDDVDENDRAARRRRRVTFLAVAATVIAIVAAALALNAFAPSATHHTPSVTRPPAPKLEGLRLGNAAIVLPKGWVARPYREYLPEDEGNAYGKNVTWCLTPRDTPVSTTADVCPVQFAPLVTRQELDPSTQTGMASDPEYCVQGRHVASDVRTGSLRDFGGRRAIFFRGDITCTKRDEPATHFAQYEVPGLPGYVLYAPEATATIRSALAYIASRSTLPEQTAALWRVDLGRVVSRERSGSNVRLTLRRVYVTRRAAVPLPAPEQERTATYTVPIKLLESGSVFGPVTVGSVVSITTNGSRVTDFLERIATK